MSAGTNGGHGTGLHLLFTIKHRTIPLFGFKLENFFDGNFQEEEPGFPMVSSLLRAQWFCCDYRYNGRQACVTIKFQSLFFVTTHAIAYYTIPCPGQGMSSTSSTHLTEQHPGGNYRNTLVWIFCRYFCSLFLLHIIALKELNQRAHKNKICFCIEQFLSILFLAASL